MKVLIGYDGSPSADTALEELKRAGLPSDSKILVVTVGSIWMPPTDIVSLPAAALTSRRLTATMAQLQNQAERTLKEAEELSGEAAARIKSDFPEWQVGTEIMSGDAGGAIIEKAAGWQADLIVVGSQNRSAVGRFFLGSVSQKIVIEASCSVRVARGAATADKNAARRIVAGIDNSDAGSSVVEAIARRSWTPDTEVLILTGIEAFADDGISASKQLDNLNELQKAAAARLNAVGLKASTVIKGSDATNELLVEAEKWNADCIFVGTRDIRGTLDRFLIGSVSTDVATNAPCSVEVVRARAE